MFCAKCGKQVEDSAKFCMACGQPVPAGPMSAGEPLPVPGSLPAAPAIPARRSGRRWLAAVCVVALLAGGGFAAWKFLLPSGPKPWGDDPVLEKEAAALDGRAAELQDALKAKDPAAAIEKCHPLVQGEYKKIFEAHATELDRVAKLLKTRKLIAINRNIAEYEVTEDGETFVVTFEKIGEKWCLTGL